MSQKRRRRVPRPPTEALLGCRPHLPRRVRARLVAEILPVYAVMRWRMTRTDFRELVKRCRVPPPGAPSSPSLPSAEAHLAALRIGHAVGRTLTVLPTDTRCLIQSLVTLRLLSLRGIPCRLVIGARTSDSFAAHAWIEHDGGAVLPIQGFDDYRLLEL